MGNFPLHPYDVVMLVILAAATFFGLWKGLAWQVASVASFVLSYFVAVQGSSSLAPLLPLQAPWNHLAAMLILFVATSAAVWLVFRLVAGVIDKIQLKAFDRQLGALLGLFKGVLICLVVTFFAVTLSESLRQEVLRARSGYYIALLIDRIKPVLPTEVRDLVGQYIEELDQKLQQPAAPESNDQQNPQNPLEGLFPPARPGNSNGGRGEVGSTTPGSNIPWGTIPGAAAEAAAGLSDFFSRHGASGSGGSTPSGNPLRNSAQAPSAEPPSGPSQPKSDAPLAPLVPIR
ncbi:MAG TPA: CvpA family protein [Thermoguttaceae bacterium]|nr:CvpA family protein [Thermoguttaceae bacterium]